MQAVVYQGSDVIILEVAKPRPREKELLIRVKATALNRADLMQRDGYYPGPDLSPDGHRIPGLEYSGVVEEIGPDVRGYQPGDRVFGLVPTGGHAEYVVTHERLAMPVPDALDWTEAAAIPEAFLTAHDAFARAKLVAGQTVLVHAAGSGVGIACTQLAVARQAKVIATVGSDAKAVRLRKMGASTTVNRKTQRFLDTVLSETAGLGADLVIDFVGAPYLEDNVRALRKGGIIVVLGLLGGDTGVLPLRDVLLKWITLVGSTMRGRSLEEHMALNESFTAGCVPLFADGQLRPVVDSIFTLGQVSEAHLIMRENRNFGKIILTP